MTTVSFEVFPRVLDALLWPEQDPKLRRKRERILRTATGLFERHGYRKTSVDQVARQAGVAKGTVYLYYRNKAELVYHAIAFEKRAYVDRVAPIFDLGMTPVDRLRAMIAIGVMLSREMPLTSSLIRGDHEIAIALEEMDEKVLTDVNEQQVTVTMQLLHEAGANWSTDELRRRGQVLMDLMFAVATTDRVPEAPAELEVYARTLADAIVGGIVNTAGTPLPDDLFNLSPAPTDTSAIRVA